MTIRQQERCLYRYAQGNTHSICERLKAHCTKRKHTDPAKAGLTALAKILTATAPVEQRTGIDKILDKILA